MQEDRKRYGAVALGEGLRSLAAMSVSIRQDGPRAPRSRRSSEPRGGGMSRRRWTWGVVFLVALLSFVGWLVRPEDRSVKARPAPVVAERGVGPHFPSSALRAGPPPARSAGPDDPVPGPTPFVVRTLGPDGAALSHVTVWFADGDARRPALLGITDADGLLASSAPLAAGAGVLARKEGYLPRTRVIDEAAVGRRAVVVALDAAAEVRGRLVDGTGRPIDTPASVAFCPRETSRFTLDEAVALGERDPRSLVCISSPDGVFSMRELDPTQTYRVFASGAGLVARDPEILLVPPFRDLSIVMDTIYYAQVELVDEAGTALPSPPDFSTFPGLSLNRQGLRKLDVRVLSLAEGVLANVALPATFSNAEHRQARHTWYFVGEEADEVLGPMLLSAHLLGYEPVRAAISARKAGPDVVVERVVMRRIARGGAGRLTFVSDGDLSRVATADWEASAFPFLVVRITPEATSRDGVRYLEGVIRTPALLPVEVGDLPAGRYTIRAASPFRIGPSMAGVGSAEVRSGDETVFRLPLGAWGSLRLRIQKADRAYAGPVTFSFRSLAEPGQEGVEIEFEHGPYVVHGVRAATYEIGATFDGRALERRTASIGSGEGVTVEWTLPAEAERSR